MKNLFTGLLLAGLALTSLSGHATTFYQSAPSNNDNLGRVVQQLTLRGTGPQPLAGASELANGSYLVTITAAGAVAAHKLVVAH